MKNQDTCVQVLLCPFCQCRVLNIHVLPAKCILLESFNTQTGKLLFPVSYCTYMNKSAIKFMYVKNTSKLFLKGFFTFMQICIWVPQSWKSGSLHCTGPLPRNRSQGRFYHVKTSQELQKCFQLKRPDGWKLWVEPWGATLLHRSCKKPTRITAFTLS